MLAKLLVGVAAGISGISEETENARHDPLHVVAEPVAGVAAHGSDGLGVAPKSRFEFGGLFGCVVHC